MRILWLCSWYPSPIEPFNGDFIQRHAKAASLLNDIHVIHVIGEHNGVLNENHSESITRSGRLTEQLVIFKRGTSFIGKIISNYKWFAFYRKAIKDYIKKNDKPDIIHVHVPIKAGIIGLWIKHRYKIPLVVSEHWGIYNPTVKNSYENRNMFFKIYTKKIIRRASLFLTVSSYLGEAINQMVIKKTYHIVPNVVDTKLFCFVKKQKKEIFRFIHVSNMAPIKNTKGILNAFKSFCDQYDNAELIMIGNCDLSDSNYAKELGLLNSTVFFKGEIPYPQVAKEMQQADSFILFSDMESFSCVIAEALCSGLPVIATKVGAIPELVNKTNGILVNPGNEGALLSSMSLMINDYTSYDREQIAIEAAEKFNFISIAKGFDNIYSSLPQKQ